MTDKARRLLFYPKLEAGNKVFTTYIKIQFAGPKQTFCFRFKIFQKSLGLAVHYLSKLIENTFIFCTQFGARTLEITF